MILIFFKKIIRFGTETLALIFTTEDSRLKDLKAYTIENWKLLAEPTLHSDGTLSIFSYDNKLVHDALFYIKNKKEDYILTSLSQILIDIIYEELSERQILNNFDSPIIVCIPSTTSHILRRGYNPSELLAKKISELSSIPFEKNILFKTRPTMPQKSLRRYERFKNVKNSMDIYKRDIEKVRGRCVIIVDDIMTTGATMKEAKRVLLKYGAKKIMSVVLAH